MATVRLLQARGPVPSGTRQIDRARLLSGAVRIRGFCDPVGQSSAIRTITGTRLFPTPKGLLRGFYSTLGAGTTDSLNTGITGTNTTGVSYLLIASQLSTGGSGFGRIFTQNDSHVWSANSSSNLSFVLGGNAPLWTVPQLTAAPTVNVITYAGGSADPKMWRDGIAQTVTYVSGTRSGALSSVNQNILLGNRGAGDRGHDGAIGLFVVFDGVLDDATAQALSQNPGLLEELKRIWVPVSVASGTASITAADGVATASTLAGSSTAATTVTASAGAATASSIAGASTAVASFTQADGVATAATLQGSSGSSTITQADGTATAATMAGSSVAAAAITQADGVGSGATMQGSDAAAAPAVETRRRAVGKAVRKRYLIRGKFYLLTDDELAVLIGHELADISRRDVKVAAPKAKPRVISAEAWAAVKPLARLEALAAEMQEPEDDEDDLIVMMV